MPRASEIAALLAAPMTGPDIEIVGPRSIARPANGAMVFLNEAHAETIERLNDFADLLCIAPPAAAEQLTCTVICYDQPRLGFCLAMGRYFTPPLPTGISADATLDPNATIGVDVSIAAGARIGPDVSIGDGTIVGENCVVIGSVVIGRNCLIKPNTTIGARGFGFARDATGKPVSFHHVGTVAIGDNVEIGANCTVVRAALDTTIIEDEVKIDDQVHVAHNVVIGARSFLAAGIVLSGGVTIGNNAWIGPNATIIDHIAVGDGATVAIGSLVTRPVQTGTTVFGNPARKISRGTK